MRLLTFKELGSVKGIRYTKDHVRLKGRSGEFPRPITLSNRRIAWIESEIDAWIEQRLAIRDTKQAA